MNFMRKFVNAFTIWKSPPKKNSKTVLFGCMAGSYNTARGYQALSSHMTNRTDPKALEIIEYLEEKLSPAQYCRNGPFPKELSVLPANIAPQIGSGTFDFYLGSIPDNYFERVVWVGLCDFAERFEMDVFLYCGAGDCRQVSFRYIKPECAL